MSTISSTFKHALIYSGASLLGKAVGFIMLPVYAHYLRGEGYGIIGMIDVVLSVIMLFIGYGIQGAMTRFHFEKKTTEERNEVVSTAIFVMLILVVTVSLPAILLNRQIAFLAFGNANQYHYITLAVFTFIADMSGKNAESYILIRQESFFYSILSLCRLTLALSLNIYLIVYLKLGVLGYLYSGLIVAVVFTLIKHGWALYNVGIHFNKKDAIAIVKWSVPLLPGYVAMFFRGNVDRVILRASLGLTKLGAYQMLFKFATLIGFLVVEPFNKIWNVKRFEIAESPNGPEVMAKVFNLQLAVLLFIGLILSVEIPLILRVLTPQEFWIGGHIAFLAVMSRVILASYYHFYFGLLYAKKTHMISIIQISSAVVSVIANMLLIIPYGIMGAVVASCMANASQCYLGFRMSQGHYRINYEWSKVLPMVGMVLFIFLFLDWLSIDKYDGWSQWIESTIGPPLTVFLGLVHIDLVRDGKLSAYIVNNLPIVIEGLLKFVFSWSFVIGLILTNIIPRQKLIAIVKARSLLPISNS